MLCALDTLSSHNSLDAGQALVDGLGFVDVGKEGSTVKGPKKKGSRVGLQAPEVLGGFRGSFHRVCKPSFLIASN